MSNLSDFYNKLFGSSPQAFGDNPIPLVKGLTKHISSGTVVDIGAGDGRNALYLGKLGFQVTAIDISEVGLARIKDAATHAKLDITTTLLDITQEHLLFDGFDAAVIAFVLHHIKSSKATALIKDWKSSSKNGAIHAIATFTSEGDFYKDPKQKENFYPAPGQLKTLYSDWKILTYSEVVRETLAKNQDGTPMKNLTAFLIAQKP